MAPLDLCCSKINYASILDKCLVFFIPLVYSLFTVAWRSAVYYFHYYIIVENPSESITHGYLSEGNHRCCRHHHYIVVIIIGTPGPFTIDSAKWTVGI